MTTELLGFELLAHVELAAAPVVTTEVLEVTADVDRALIGDLRSEEREQRTVFVGRFDAQSRVQAGDEIEVAVSSEHFHFFDLESELAIEVGRAA